MNPFDQLKVVIVEDPCPDCGAPTEGACKQCGRRICMECYRHYEWKVQSDICWLCKNEADMKRLATL